MTIIWPDDLYECPHCGSQFTHGFSGSRWGMTFTDGLSEDPLGSAPYTPLLCPHCGGVLWMHELGRLRSTRRDEEGLPRRPRTPDFFEYLEIAESLTDNPRSEIHVRQLARWRANDNHRSEGGAVKWKRVGANLDALLRLLDETDPRDRVEKADVLRTVGRCEEAVALLGDLEWLNEETVDHNSDQEARIRQTLQYAASTTVFDSGQSELFMRADAILILAKKKNTDVLEIREALKMRDPTYIETSHLTIQPDWRDRNIWIRFVDDKTGISYEYPHDEFIRELDKRNPRALSRAWRKGKYTLKKLPNWGRYSWFRNWLDGYRV
jgi:hypothetical protein